ncbi:UDP-N-acetylglucosamine diphosphorylase/glucosamine-1-phosphate N-acetyltransferase [Saccharophagus sp. K07]|uniref:bifunctional UDP-N-acetylglucosamine diphosphorylase/glucosamine-1-phosphate N-acetyltransferase GlmU n=1 Tax=Saccharophagus sp. K07 TaxID=2283636 RepID=UPI0016525473|nr:bifunctional UDP-N-acetylglucosamine diphosphorylase/glucosamine-1-phosphate N-acetyltransferase GlmU [Saccharophagus sp. K07]MBC6906150.1 UDP-N-acetylglucosamine diphosphorylase/glucosamine-1-phosphate N-acetyltransferase [Saccharophagus sp. K07]
MLEAIVLAAGKGTRMKSNLPKVMHPLAGKPFLQHVLETTRSLAPANIHLVLGHGADVVQASLNLAEVNVVPQEQQLGTGHAVMQVLPQLADDSVVLILYGDVPLISRETLEKLASVANRKALGLLTVRLPDPTGYGRVLRDQQGNISAIVEQKDASPEQLTINEVNTGFISVHAAFLRDCLPKLSNQNAQGEYYLTDIIALAKAAGLDVVALETRHLYEVQGVNNRQQQAELERLFQQHQAQKLMEQGLTLLDPARFDCRGDLQIGADCIVDINCVFEGRVVLGNNVRIGPNCLIKDAVIGDDVEIEANSVIDDAKIGPECHIGPFARVRPGSQFAKGAKVGNFVETKKAVVGEGSKINHLSYVGDAELGANVNVGAGTITCNYDGVNKHKTRIGNDVFVGSNTALVAPVEIADGATVAAGSTITLNVKTNQLAVARERQRNVDGWQRPKK